MKTVQNLDLSIAVYWRLLYIRDKHQNLICWLNNHFIQSKVKMQHKIFSWRISLTLCMLDNFSCFSCGLLTFSKLISSKDSFRKTIRVSNNIDPDQDRHYVGPDLGPNCLHRLPADDKSSLARKEYIIIILPVSVYLYLDISSSERGRTNGRREPV